MRVCLDCTPLLVRSGGVKTYLYELQSHLRRLAPEGDLSTFPFLDRPGPLDHDASVLGRGSTFGRLLLLHFLNNGRSPIMDLLLGNIDVFHASNQIRNPPRRARLTTMVHDMTSWLLPEVHTPGNVANDKAFAENIVKRARGVIVPSESSRNDAIRILGLDPARVQVIHHGISDDYFGNPKLSPAARARYKVNRAYLLFISTIEPRKNLDRLLDAYAALTPDIRDEFELIVAGPIGWNSANTVQRLQSGMPGVRYLGYVPEEHLPGLTAGASIFVYPSLYEGFGFPVAQAMAAGVPVIASNNSSIPEVAGDAARLVDPRSTEEIRASLADLLLSPSIRSHMRDLGRERAQRFQWIECARKTWTFFEHVCGM
ncbi:MAG: glycosyltransferase family 4 protein [Acidobacteriota bacterium]|nr:glycosyltransferase family 4 protein [Acidobacteriota bacterium]